MIQINPRAGCYSKTVTQVLPHSINDYAGVQVNPEHLPDNPEHFKQQLEFSLDVWRAEGYVYVWLQVPITRSVLIPVAVSLGFGFHHSHENYLMMGLKLVKEVVELPSATHYAGAGGVVLSADNKLLVIRERVRRAGRTRPYKLPGGYINAGEHISDGVTREVFEETGVRTEFESLVCVRHWHADRFGKSDFYFVCRLKPLTFEITPQEEEIEEALWMPVETYLAHEDVHAFNKGIVMTAMRNHGMVSGWFEGYEQQRNSREIFLLP